MGVRVIRQQPKAGRISTTTNLFWRGRLVIVLACLFLSARNIYLSVFVLTRREDFDALSFQAPRIQETRPQYDRHNVHVVVSHCDQSVGWIWKDFGEEEQNKRLQHPPIKHELKSVTIISKCNVTIPLDDLPEAGSQPLVQILSLPNVGRNDHSYAYWIKEVLLMTGKDVVGGNSAGHPPRSQTQEIYSELLYSSQDESNENENPFQKIARIIDPADMVFFLKDNANAQYTYAGISLGLLDILDQLAPSRISPVTINSSSLVSNFSRPITTGFCCELYYTNKRFIRMKKREGVRLTPLSHRSFVWDFKLQAYNRLTRDKTSEMFPSLHRPMGNWINHLYQQIEPETEHPNTNLQTLFSKEYYELVKNTNFTMPENVTMWPFYKPDLIPMCYGGNFATYWGQMASVDSALTTLGWIAVTKSLSRGNNIEEGHFMERWWADLLSFSSWADQMTFQQQQQQQHSAKSTNNKMTTAFKNASRVSGIPISEAEQQLLLTDEGFAISVCALNVRKLEGSQDCSIILDFDHSLFNLV